MQAMQDAHRQLHGGDHHAQPCVPLQIVEERLQQFVEDLGGGVHRMQVADTWSVSDPAVEFIDLHESQR
ncbi:MAG: hypothetical protein L0K86_21640 [Actinomycetia bacterium]|nr:hypothetical protein [Actinomycetes bacterium]